MRRSSTVMLVVLAVLCGGCTATGGEGHPDAAEPEQITFSSLGIDWPAPDAVEWAALPNTPDGFDDSLRDQLARQLESWAELAATDEEIAHSEKALDEVVDALPAAIGKPLRAQIKDLVSPRLAVANVFADDVEIIGSPRITSAWKLSAPKDDQGRPYLRLQLQTRTAYEVQVDGGPIRVIGVLRIHTLGAYAADTDEFAVGFAWQEFGAADCPLALDDQLTVDDDADHAREDLATFVRIGSRAKLEMPKLGAQDQVDAEFLKRCKAGAV